jgi:hypothetical protein
MPKVIDNRVFWRIARLVPRSWTERFAYRCAFRECMEDPAFRAELDRWVPVDSPEGQRILREISGTP